MFVSINEVCFHTRQVARKCHSGPLYNFAYNQYNTFESLNVQKKKKTIIGIKQYYI